MNGIELGDYRISDNQVPKNELCWNVFVEDINLRKIVVENIFDFNWVFTNGVIKCYKEYKKHPDMSKEIFMESIRKELMHEYWCRSEYETVVTDWPPHVDSEEIDRLVKEREDRIKNWGNFYCTDINPLIATKIDIYMQVMLNWHAFSEYLWNHKDLIKKLKKVL